MIHWYCNTVTPVHHLPPPSSCILGRGSRLLRTDVLVLFPHMIVVIGIVRATAAMIRLMMIQFRAAVAAAALCIVCCLGYLIDRIQGVRFEEFFLGSNRRERVCNYCSCSTCTAMR